MELKRYTPDFSRVAKNLMVALSVSSTLLVSVQMPVFSDNQRLIDARIGDQGGPSSPAPAIGKAPVFDSEELAWQTDFDTAMVEAKEQKKHVLVDVYTDWCGYCKKLDKEVYADPEVSKYLAENFIVVRANAEDGAQGQHFSDKFDAHAYPTIMVFDYKSKKEKPVFRIAGYMPKTEFSTAMHCVLEAKKYKPKHKA